MERRRLIGSFILLRRFAQKNSQSRCAVTIALLRICVASVRMMFLGVVVVFMSATSICSQTVTFLGHVTEQTNGQPITGAAIVAEGNQTGTRVAITDAQGNYILSFGGNSNIRLRAYLPNYVLNPVLVTILDPSGFPITGAITKDFAGTSFPFLPFGRPPALLTEDNSLNALTLDNVTNTRDPFTITTDAYPGNDKRTRLTLFVVDLDLYPNQGETLAGTVSAKAQSGPTSYTLTPEDLRKVPGAPWLSQLIVRLPEDFILSGVTTAQVTVTARGEVSRSANLKFK